MALTIGMASTSSDIPTTITTAIVQTAISVSSEQMQSLFFPTFLSYEPDPAHIDTIIASPSAPKSESTTSSDPFLHRTPLPDRSRDAPGPNPITLPVVVLVIVLVLGLCSCYPLCRMLLQKQGGNLDEEQTAQRDGSLSASSSWQDTRHRRAIEAVQPETTSSETRVRGSDRAAELSLGGKG